MYDILEEKRESKGIIVQDMDPENGFVSLPDEKWRDHCKISKVPLPRLLIENTLYVLSIVRDRSIRSVRDLRAHHVDLLENLMGNTIAAIEKVYGLKRDKLRIYVHYPPRYYHFHVHFVCLAIKSGTCVGRAILLEDVIDNLKMNGRYYEKANLSCIVSR